MLWYAHDSSGIHCNFRRKTTNFRTDICTGRILKDRILVTVSSEHDIKSQNMMHELGINILTQMQQKFRSLCMIYRWYCEKQHIHASMGTHLANRCHPLKYTRKNYHNFGKTPVLMSPPCTGTVEAKHGLRHHWKATQFCLGGIRCRLHRGVLWQRVKVDFRCSTLCQFNIDYIY